MNQERVVKAGLLGLGTVGSGVYKLVERQKDEMALKAGAGLEIQKILVHNMNKKREGVDQSLLTDKWEDIMNDDEIEIVIEVMGGIEPARTMILEALHAGKNVVTANKDLVATHGHELLEAAEESGVDFLFEAAVAGAIPNIRPLKQWLAANEIQEVIGIVNGTTNFILTKMIEEGMDFDDALALATELGYAEADPTFDIEGLDTGHKLSILTSLAFGVPFHFDITAVEGIKGISSFDIQFAQKLGFVVKLLATVEKINDRLSFQVAPTLISQNSILAQVSDAMNAVEIVGDAVGKTLFYGAGAGGEATASAVLADVTDIAKGHKSIVKPDSATVVTFQDNNEKRNKNYIRFNSSSLNDLTNHVLPTLEKHQIVVEKIEEINENLVLLTQEIDEKTLQKALTELSQTYCNQLSFTRFRLAKSVN